MICDRIRSSTTHHHDWTLTGQSFRKQQHNKEGFTQRWLAGKHVLKCLLSPDSRQMVTTSADKTIKLWNLDGFTLERTLTGTISYLVDRNYKRPLVFGLIVCCLACH